MTLKAMQLVLVASIPILALAEFTMPNLNLNVNETQPSFININWQVNGTDSIDWYSVEVAGDSDDSVMSYKGKEYINENSAKVVVHEPNKAYNICVIAWLKEEAQQELNVSKVKECTEASTIATMRPSSIIALALVIAFFLLCVLVGYIAWKCAARKQKSQHEYEKTDVNGNGDIVPLTNIED